MKKLIIAIALIVPSLALATGEAVNINAITPTTCDTATVNIAGTASYDPFSFQEYLRVKLDGNQIYDSAPFKPTNWNAGNKTVGVGMHTVVAQIYAWFTIWASDIETFVVNACAPLPPVDVCPNLEGLQETVPEGYQIVDGQCVAIVEPEPEPEPPTPETPKVMTGDSGAPLAIVLGIAPCFGLTGNFFDACVIQKYPNGQMCELVPIRTCFGLWKDCVPEAPRCKYKGRQNK